MYALSKPGNGDYVRVAGYTDGSDWFIYDGNAHGKDCGLAGERFVWITGTGPNGQLRLRIFDATERRLVADIALGINEGNVIARVTARKGGNQLYAFTRQGLTACTLTVIETATGQILRRYEDLPLLRDLPAIQQSSGKLLYHSTGPRSEVQFVLEGMVTIDPETGAVSTDIHNNETAAASFFAPSPDGCYWLRPDLNVLPVQDISDSRQRFMPWRQKQRYYGLTLQLWETDPLRFVRRIVVAWLQADELPDQADCTLPERQAIWNAIHASTQNADVGPLGGMQRTHFPNIIRDDDEAWKKIDSNRMELARWVRHEGWQADGQAFWVETNGFLSCVGIDGSISPRLYLERKGLRNDTWLPCAYGPQAVTPLPGRRARVDYRNDAEDRIGAAIFDGSPSTAPFGVKMIPRHSDHWVPFDPGEDAGLSERIEKLKTEQRTIVVNLPELSEAGSISALDALTELIDDNFRHRAVDGDIRAVFKIGAKRLGEDKFFGEVQTNFPGAAPALRRMIDRFATNDGNGSIFWKGEKGIGAFGHGVHALGVLDSTALPTIRRYGFLVDAGHESFFTTKTVPAILKAHGWTDEVIDFMIWVMLRNFYNSLQDLNEIWKDWGMRDAVVSRMTPQAFAARVSKEIDDILFFNMDPARFGNVGMDQLFENIPKPHEPWVRDFFTELEILARTKPNHG